MDYKYEGWAGFEGGTWQKEINVRSFIRHNYTPYDGDESFLVGPTKDTKDLWEQVLDLTRQEREAGGVLDMDTKVISTITSHGPGYLNKDKEKIVGFQTEKPFKRALMPYGGIRMAEKALKDNGYENDTEKHITQVYLMLTPLKCALAVQVILSQVFPMLTAVAVLSVTTAV